MSANLPRCAICGAKGELAKLRFVSRELVEGGGYYLCVQHRHQILVERRQ